MRLNQFLAKHLGISRRQADTWITDQKVKLNQKPSVLGQKVDLETDTVEIFLNNGWQNITQVLKDKTILFYKPIFCLTTRFDPEKRKTIYHFLDQKYHSLKPAGRLDYMSEGLLVLSSNGDLIQQLTHPKFSHTKEYLVSLKNPFNKDLKDKLEKGIELDNYVLNPVKVEEFKNFEEFEYLKLNRQHLWYKFTLSEGRQNQIRRICELDNQKVLRLIRIKQGQFEISKELYQKRVIDI
jgi:pseudouridine synthase